MAGGIVQILLLQRKYAEALHEAERVKDELLAHRPEGLCSKYEVIGIAKKMLKDEAGAREALLIAKERGRTIPQEAPNEAPRACQAGADSRLAGREGCRNRGSKEGHRTAPGKRRSLSTVQK